MTHVYLSTEWESKQLPTGTPRPPAPLKKTLPVGAQTASLR